MTIDQSPPLGPEPADPSGRSSATSPSSNQIPAASPRRPPTLAEVVTVLDQALEEVNYTVTYDCSREADLATLEKVQTLLTELRQQIPDQAVGVHGIRPLWDET